VRLLLVEDDVELAGGLRKALARSGYAVDLAHDGIDGEFLGDEEPYDAVILDLGLPGRPGLEVLAHWRARGNRVPVIVLTGRDAWHERVDGFKAGADDYLGKPFHIEELLARVQAVLRRTEGRGDPVIRTRRLRLDESRQEVVLLDSEQVVALTGTEFRLLRYFMLHPRAVLSKTRLTEHVYDQAFEHDSNLIEVYVSRLRDKLGRELFATRRGQGYVLEDDPG